MRQTLLVVMIGMLPLHALAWGWEGHKLVCALAEEQLSTQAKAMVQELLADGGELKGGVVSFPEACLWPDDVKYSTRRNTYENHFINVPDDATSIDLARDCGALDCIVVAVQRALTYLSEDPASGRERARKAAALRFLGHHIGDLHQPMHVGNASDWGGNKIAVTFSGTSKETNLHALWDYGMLETMNYRYPDSLSHLAEVKHDKDDSNVLDWMDESLQLARTHAYVDTRGQLIRSGDVLGNRYLERSKPVIIERLTLAGSRLADLLNRIAAGESPSFIRLTPLD